MRAVSWDKDAASLMGINVDNNFYYLCYRFSLCSCGRVLLGLYYNTLYPLMGFMPGLKAFIAAVLVESALFPALLPEVFVGYCRGTGERLLEQCVA